MTAAELERLARAVIPPERATGWRITIDDAGTGSTYAVVPIIDHRTDGRPVFRGEPRDCYRFIDILTGRVPTSRRAQNATLGTTAPTVAPPWLVEAPEHGATVASGVGDRLCAGCGEPLPAGARSKQTTHGPACRVRAFRHRAADEGSRVAADTTTGVVTAPGPNFEGPASPGAPDDPETPSAGRSGARDQAFPEGPVPPAGLSSSTVSTQPTSLPVPTSGGGQQLLFPSG